MGRESRSTADQLDLYASSDADLEGRQEFRKSIRPNDHAVTRPDLGVEAGQGGPYGRPNPSWTTIRTQNPVTAGRSHVAQSSHFDEFESEIL